MAEGDTRIPGFIPKIRQEIVDQIERKYLDIAYCDQSPAQVVDIYYPDGEYTQPYPVIVYFHGGGFRIGAKDDVDLEPMLRGLKRGYVLVSAEYRKSDEARFPAALYDAKAVIRFLRANAALYQMDPSRIGVWGPSAGGWIVGMLGVTAENPAFEDLTMGNAKYASNVDAVVDWCGPCGNFLDMDAAAIKSGLVGRRPHNDPESPESKFLGAPITTVPELCRLAAPYVYAHADIPPFLIVHGSGDKNVPIEQSITFYRALTKAAGEDRAELFVAEGQPHHGNSWYTKTWLSDHCLDFFDEALQRHVNNAQ